MCATCGCSDDSGVMVTRVGNHDHDHDHDHDQDHTHSHDPTHGHSHEHEHGHSHDHDQAGGHDHDHDHSERRTETITLEQDVLAKNALMAARNRGWFEGKGILALNFMSSPGSGKTTLLERTIRDLKDDLDLSVVEGDQETLLDAERIRATGCEVVQINTGSGCHLDADMLARGVDALSPATGSVVLIENVGNLVCPALFDLGEAARVVIMSVTEGADKPIKYPHMFRDADVVILNKVDLLPYVDFDVDRCVADAGLLRPGIEVISVSATTGEGLDRWYDWLRERRAAI